MLRLIHVVFGGFGWAPTSFPLCYPSSPLGSPWFPSQRPSMVSTSPPDHSQVIPRSLPGHSQVIPRFGPAPNLFPTYSQLIPRSFPDHSQVIPRFGESQMVTMFFKSLLNRMLPFFLPFFLAHCCVLSKFFFLICFGSPDDAQTLFFLNLGSIF